LSAEGGGYLKFGYPGEEKKGGEGRMRLSRSDGPLLSLVVRVPEAESRRGVSAEGREGGRGDGPGRHVENVINCNDVVGGRRGLLGELAGHVLVAGTLRHASRGLGSAVSLEVGGAFDVSGLENVRTMTIKPFAGL
jgi:hypothetical protein